MATLVAGPEEGYLGPDSHPYEEGMSQTVLSQMLEYRERKREESAKKAQMEKKKGKQERMIEDEGSIQFRESLKRQKFSQRFEKEHERHERINERNFEMD